MTRVNLADVSTIFPILPNGTYPCRFVGAEYVAKAKSSGQPYYLLTFAVDEELEPTYGGQKLFRNLSVQPQALWALKGALKAMGADEDILASNDVDLDEVFASLVGALVDLKVGTRTYQDQERNEVQAIVAHDIAY